jgi:surface carbohydrate biosynthesis protein (TIGR04326 family)
MNYFPAKGDWNDLPLPDCVVCHGKRFHEVLEAAGYPSPRLVVGPSLRYAHLLEAPPPTRDGTGEATPTVLILLSIVLPEAAEVLWKSVQGLRGMTGIHVMVRPHPFMPLRKVLAKVGESQVAVRLEEAQGPLEQTLKYADCVIYRDTSAAFEAAAWGIPCVYVSSEVAADNDPLDLLGPLDGLKRVASSPAEIRLAVEEILRGDWTVRKTWQMVGKRLRERTLTPIDAEGLSRFAAGFALELTSIGFVPPGDAETPGSVSTKTP